MIASVKEMETKHWALVGAMLIGLGTQLGGLQHGWHDATTTAFVGGLCIQIGTTIGALFVGAPQKKWDGADRRTTTGG